MAPFLACRSRRGARLVAAVLAWTLLCAAPAAAQEDLWQQYPLDPSPTPETRDASPAARSDARPVSSAAEDDGGGSGTAWIVAAVLGIAGIGLTIAGLSIARREPQAPEATQSPAANGTAGTTRPTPVPRLVPSRKREPRVAAGAAAPRGRDAPASAARANSAAPAAAAERPAATKTPVPGRAAPAAESGAAAKAPAASRAATPAPAAETRAPAQTTAPGRAATPAPAAESGAAAKTPAVERPAAETPAPRPDTTHAAAETAAPGPDRTPAAERPAADAAAPRPDAPPAPAAPPPAPAREAAPLPPAPPRKRAERLRDQRAAPAKAAAGPAPSPDWEECQVSLSFDAGDEHHFLAAPATGDPVARSPVFTAHRTSTVMESAEAREALQALVTSLLEDGWQLVGRDGDPWALRFRRRVRAPVTPVRHPAGR